jgi:serine/threonine protein kinase
MSDKPKKGGKGAAGPAGDSLIGKVLGGRYRLDVLLGKGSMGRVYRAEHVLMHKPLAVKVLNAEHTKSPEIVARFEREATAAANIEHPNVVAATDFGKLDDGTVYLALELVQGKNLRAEISSGPLEVRRALHIARQVAAGLAAAHARKIVHRDLKPENIVLVEKDGDPDFVKVLDFGIAKLTPESGKSPLTKVGVVLGTLDYMAPEQALGQEVDHRADLYALGVVTYEMLCGVCPYEGESSSAILGLQLTKPPPSLRERAPTLAVPGAVEALVMKLLAKERKERPHSAAVVVLELDKLAASLPGGAQPAKKPAAGPRFPPPRPATGPIAARQVPTPAAPPAPVPTAPPPRAPAPPPPPSSRAPAPPAPMAPSVQNKSTFLPSDPLPAFTFPPLEEESKKLAAEVQAAIAAREAQPPAAAPVAPGSAATRSSASVDSLLAKFPPTGEPPAPPFTSPVSSSPSVDALLASVPTAGSAPPSPAPGEAASPSGIGSILQRGRARGLELLRKLRAHTKRGIEAAIVWIDDHRRLLPRVIKRPLRRVPSGAIFVGLVVLLAVVLVTIVLLAAGSDESPADASRVASVSASPPAPSAPTVAPDSASDAGSRAALARAEAELKAGNWSGVTAAIDVALASNPASKQNQRVAEMLGEAARHKVSSSAAFKLLSDPMEGKGAEILYDLAAHPKTPNDTRAKAEAWLASEDFRRVASPPLAIAGKLRAARGCEEKKALLGDAVTTGDRRALEYLQILAVKGGCGRRGREDCFPCLREDEKLGDAIAKIERRLAGASKAP